MKLPHKLSASSPMASWCNEVVEYLRSLTPANSTTARVTHSPFGIIRQADNKLNSGKGWHFESKIEVDNTKSYPAQTVIHIQPTDALVTAGIRDAANPTGGLVTSCAGYWVSTQAVPAKTTVSGNDVWNLPQFPLPAPTNIDDPLNFWIYLGEVAACPA